MSDEERLLGGFVARMASVCDVHRGSYRWFAGCSENGEGGERGAERCQRVCGFVGSCWRVQQVGIG